MKKTTILLLCIMLIFSLTGCGKQEVPQIDPDTVERYTLPSSVSFTNDEMREALLAYEALVNETLLEEGFQIHFARDEEDYIHLSVAYPDWKREATVEKDVKIFYSLKETFASLYLQGQIDKDGQVSLTKEEIISIYDSLKETADDE